MKRLTIFRGPLVITLACFTVLCMGQRRSRVTRGKIIQLTEPRLTGSVSFEEALARRRSVRQFVSQPLSSSQISQLAWAGQGITEPQRGLRTAPSAGALYPIELYFATPEGVSVYQPQGHSLRQVLDQDVRGALAATSMQGSVAGCDIIVAGSVRKLTAQFRKDARKYMLLEAGHVAQNIQLQAVCLGLGSVTVGGFDISGVRKICRLPRELEPIYIICVGYPLAQATTEADQGQESTGAKRAVLIVAPTVLANAGVLTGVRATSFLSERERLVQAGAVYTGVPVERDRFIITGSGPTASAQFGRAVADALAGR